MSNYVFGYVFGYIVYRKTLGTKNMPARNASHSEAGGRSSEVGARGKISIRGIVLMAGSLKMSGTKKMRSSGVGARGEGGEELDC